MADLLAHGPEREPRRLPPRLRRSAAAGLVVALAAPGTAALTQDRARDRAAQRTQAATFAQADEVHLRGSLSGLSGDRGGRILADVEISGQRRGRVTSVRLEGDGLRGVPGPAPLLGELPGQAFAEATVDCAAIPEHVPRRAAVVVTVVPASGVEHEQRLPASPSVLREAVLQACDVPDRHALPRAEAQAQDGRLVLYLETVARERSDLVLEAVTVPGFEVTGRLPERLPPSSGGLYAFSVRVTDCSLAVADGLPVTVRLRYRGESAERTAGTVLSQPQPGAVPAGELLAGLAAAAC